MFSILADRFARYFARIFNNFTIDSYSHSPCIIHILLYFVYIFFVYSEES